MALPEIDAIVERLDAVIADARARRHRLGFFAAMYRQVTLCVGREVESGAFDDDARMARFVALFAGRYLGASTSGRRAAAHPVLAAAFRAAERQTG